MAGPTLGPPPPLRLRLARVVPGPALVRSDVEVDADVFEIGRRPDADLVLDARAASRRHARIIAADGAWWVEDLGSRLGTRQDGRRLPPGRHRLLPGSVIDLPGATLGVRPADPPPVLATTAARAEAAAAWAAAGGSPEDAPDASPRSEAPRSQAATARDPGGRSGGAVEAAAIVVAIAVLAVVAALFVAG